MTNKEKCDCVVSGRITQTEKQKMQEHNFKIRDAIQDKIAMMEDPHKLLRYRRNVLRNEIRTLKYELECKQRELDEINHELGLNDEINTHYNLDIVDAGNNIIGRYETKKGKSKYTIDDYLTSIDGERVLKHQILLYAGNDKEDFKNKLIRYVQLQCKH